MGKIIVVTADTNLEVEEFDTIEEAEDKLLGAIEDGNLNPMNCEVLEGELLDFRLKVNIAKKTP